MRRYRAVSSGGHILRRGDWTGWLGREDSLMGSGSSVGPPETLLKSAASALQFEMRKFESCPPG
jgi:hypothetical protein